MRFEWDENKNSANKKKHGISFEEASTAFQDVNALVIADPEHSDNEDRFILLGLSIRLNLVGCLSLYEKGRNGNSDNIRQKSDDNGVEAVQRFLRRWKICCRNMIFQRQSEILM